MPRPASRGNLVFSFIFPLLDSPDSWRRNIVAWALTNLAPGHVVGLRKKGGRPAFETCPLGHPRPHGAKQLAWIFPKSSCLAKCQMMGWGKRGNGWDLGLWALFGQGLRGRFRFCQCRHPLPLFPMGGESRFLQVWGNAVLVRFSSLACLGRLRGLVCFEVSDALPRKGFL